MLRAIERATRQVIEPMNLPTVDAVNALRITKFKQRVIETAAQADAQALRPVVEQLEAETGLPLLDIAAALASLSQGGAPLLLGGQLPATPRSPESRALAEPRESAEPRRAPEPRRAAEAQGFPEPQRVVAVPRPIEAHRPIGAGRSLAEEPPRKGRAQVAGSSMETFRIEVGSTHGIKPSNVVGAIANESGIEGVHIGRIDIREDHSFVDLPQGMPKTIFKMLQKVLVAGRELRISRLAEHVSSERAPASASAHRLKARQPPKSRKLLTRPPPPARGKRD
jgi:ATP-dependent RNA helicase DeaD